MEDVGEVGRQNAPSLGEIEFLPDRPRLFKVQRFFRN